MVFSNFSQNSEKKPATVLQIFFFLNESVNALCEVLTGVVTAIDIYLNINQLDALNFIMSLFRASAYFENHVLIIRRSKLYYTASGIITPIGVTIPDAVLTS